MTRPMWHDSVKGSGGIEKSLRQHANASIHSNDRSHGAKINKTGQASQYLGFGIGAWKKHTGKNLHLLRKKHWDEHAGNNLRMMVIMMVGRRGKSCRKRSALAL